MDKTYTLQDGGKITATCPSDFLTKLRTGSRFDSECTDEEYMKAFAERYKIQSGHDIRTDSPENFFEDLVQTDYIR